MENENSFHDLGRELGHEGVERLVGQAEEVCAHERRRIELTNESRVIGLRLELTLWADEDERLTERLRLATPPGDRRSHRVKVWLAGGVAAALTLAGFFLSVLAFDPFRLGWKSYLYCIGIAIVCPFCVGKCLEEWDRRKLLKGVATVACVAAIASLILLAIIRGKLLVQDLEGTPTAVVVADDSTDAPQTENHFYDETLPILQLTMALLAVAMELGAGLSFHNVQSLAGRSGEDSEKLARERMSVRHRIADLMSQVSHLSNEGAVFESRFWRNFYAAMLRHTARKALGKALIVVVCLAAGALGVRAEQSPLNLVIAIDLSASTASRGPDGKTDFEKNVNAVTRLLEHAPAGSQVTIIGITGNSFAEPDILLRAVVPPDSGYFGERLVAAHHQLLDAWKRRTAHLAPSAKQTDILGALLVAEQLLQKRLDTERRVLIIYSDMRQATEAVNLERLTASGLQFALGAVKRSGLQADLRGVDIEMLGVDAVGCNPREWNKLKQFWAAYFMAASANVRTLSVLREMPGSL